VEALTALHYRPGTSLLHGLDVRCKLVCLCILGMALARAGALPLSANTLLLAILVRCAGLSPRKDFRGLGLFFVLLGCIFLSRALFTEGEIALDLLPGLAITRQGLVQGTLVVWRFFLVMVLGVLFAATTRPSLVKGGAQWLISFLPFVPAPRVAVMVSLFLRFLPMLLSRFQEVSLAQQARLGNLQRNPARRLSRLAVPMIRRTFLSADRLTLAMEARCFSETRTDPEFVRSGREGLALGVCLGLAAAMLLF
jgi:biotin transport system permease protein